MVHDLRVASLDLGERVVTSPTGSTWLGWSGAFVATWALALGALESPRASSSARGAAAALLAQRSPGAGPRLCEAVATSAQVGLRISVARAAEGRIDEALREAAALEEVLEAAETEKPPRPVGSGGY